MIQLKLNSRKIQTSKLLQDINNLQKQVALDLPDQKYPSQVKALQDFQAKLKQLKDDVLKHREGKTNTC